MVIRLLAALLLAGSAAAAGPRGTEILWDKFGVPHIYAPTDEGLFFAHGYAQMRNHADLLLKLYGEARGRASEYWGVGRGDENLETDRWVHTNGIPERACDWHARQSPEFRGLLDAFAAGINAYARRHPELIAEERRRVLPVTGADVVGHTLRLLNYAYVTSPRAVTRAAASSPTAPGTGPMSNAWAIGPARSASGHPLLLMNPHLPWQDFYLFTEVHLNGPAGYVYGAASVGTPVTGPTFSDHIAYTQTVNAIDAADLYRLVPRDGGYVLDGVVRPFDVRTKLLRIRQPDGTLREETLTVRASVHGPVVWDRGGVMLALRVAGLDRPFALEQLWRMSRSRNLEELRGHLAWLQLPMFNLMLADAGGHIMYVYNGFMPKRPEGDAAFWAGQVPGDRSDLVWNELHSFAELPQVTDPATAFLQNSNDPPWTSTYPAVLRPEDYPAYTSRPGYTLRTNRSLELLRDATPWTFDDFIARLQSTRLLLADRILDDLLAAADRSGSAEERRAAAVLRAWDRLAENESRGTLLFEAFANRAVPAGREAEFFAVPPDPARPFETPRGIKDPAAAVRTLGVVAGEVQARFGSLDAPWGQYRRLRSGGADLPGNGASGQLGAFRVMRFAGPAGAATEAIVHGDTFVAAVELAQPTRARVLLSYGNSTQPGSPHQADQLGLTSRKALRPALLTRAEVEANLASVDRF